MSGFYPVIKPRPGQVYREIGRTRDGYRPVTNATYQVCPSCGKMVQTNKFFGGDVHLCL